MGISSYKKLKFLINKLLKNEVICKDLEEFSTMDISESTYAKFVTKLNDIKIIQPLSKGENIIKNEFLNHFYFNDKEKNSSIIAAIAHLEEKQAKFSILEYIFKLVPKNLLFMFSNNYSKEFDKNITKLMNYKKHKYFASVVEQNIETTKIICQIYNSKENLYIEIVPLELFIYENSWFITYYNIETNKLEVIDSFYIAESKISAKLFQKYISFNEIDDTAKSFINKLFGKKETIILRLKPETLNLLVKFDLSDNYMVYEDEKINENRKFFRDMNVDDKNKSEKKITSSKIRLYEIDLKSINSDYSYDEFENIDFLKNNRILFNMEDSKKYFVKIEISSKKLKYILNNFKDIEIVDMNKYYI